MSEAGWSRRFDAPIVAGRKQIMTLRDAANYVIKPPTAESRRPHWQNAMRCLMMAGDQGGILMMAAMRQALAHGKPGSAVTPRRKRAKAYKLIR